MLMITGLNLKKINLHCRLRNFNLNLILTCNSKHLMTGPEGTLRTSVEVICHIAGNFEAGNSLNLIVIVFVGQHSWVNSALLPSDVINFAMLPTPRFWWQTVSLLDVT